MTPEREQEIREWLSRTRTAEERGISGVYDSIAYCRDLLAALDQARAALAPFADPYNWHTNYDGSGIIFAVEGERGDHKAEAAILAAKLSL